MMASSNLYLCSHCDKQVSKTLYYKHKKLYYNRSLKRWQKEVIHYVEDDFHFSDDPDDIDDFTMLPENDRGEEEVSYMEEDCNTHDVSDEEFSFDDGDNSEVELELIFDEEEEINNLSQNESGAQFTIVIRMLIMFVFLWQNTFRVSDVGIDVLLKFISTFMVTLSRMFPAVGILKGLAQQLPKSAIAGRKILGTDADDFTKWVCCKSCCSIYPIKECKVKLPNGQFESKKCTFIRFPGHPQLWRRKPCGSTLLKLVKNSSGTINLCPSQIYCYKSLVSSLRELLSRSDFFEQCEHWRNRKTKPNTLSDIYNGSVWKDFMEVNGVPFLSMPYNFALSLNVDWFQPFKHTQHSIGVLYIAVQNLPREVRFLAENIIIVGIIPGPHEPSKNINSFLAPLVIELKDLWSGVVIDKGDNQYVLVRAALLCVACDIPAARKVCGFVGHQAYKGCSKCLKGFPTENFGDKADYSGFDRDSWTLRDLSSHRQHAFEHKISCTASSQTELEREHGVRYSKLLDLSYFDPVRMCIIDPMHNLLLGTAKHMLSVWKEKELISKVQLENIQKCVDSFVTPAGVGRLPTKIMSGFSGFTADQWRNWTVVFSLYSLKGILPFRDFSCWQLFVKACDLICQRQIQLQDLNKADELMMEFLSSFEQLYGKEFCTMNLHLHAHLRSCILDYGPVYSFWLFAFERMNGVLGSFQTNCHDISVQLMRKFLSNRMYSVHNWPTVFKDDFAVLLDKHKYDKGSLCQFSLNGLLNHSHSVMIEPLRPVHEHAFEPHIKSCAHDAIKDVAESNTFDILTLFEKCGALKVGRFVVGSRNSRFQSASIVKVQALGKEKLAEIQFFARCTVRCEVKTSYIWLAAVCFFPEHQCKLWYGYPTEVWGGVTDVDMHFLPIHTIQNQVVFIKCKENFGHVIGTDSVIIVTPLH